LRRSNSASGSRCAINGDIAAGVAVASMRAPGSDAETNSLYGQSVGVAVGRCASASNSSLRVASTATSGGDAPSSNCASGESTSASNSASKLALHSTASGDFGWRMTDEDDQRQQQLQRLQQQPQAVEVSASPLHPTSLQLQNNLQFRFLHPDDIDELKSLCKDCFPVEYPEEWYQEITKDDGRFFSLASTLQGRIVGFIVAEIKTRVRCNKEDQDILSPSYPLSTPIAYILSLGVSCNFRCQGVGSLLLDNLLSHLTSKDHHTCKAVFLHVLCTNSRAIRFYEKRHFTRHSFLPLYYAIQGKLKDGFSYVLYLNGGHPPWSLASSLRASFSAVASLSPCKISTRLFLRLNQLVWCFVAALFVGIKKTTNTSFAHGGYHKS